MSAEVHSFLAEAQSLTNAALECTLGDLLAGRPSGIAEPIRYAVLGAGKRFRPALVIAAYRTAGGADPRIADLAAAVEIVHAYSLVHDDLPCMDNDDLRRGRPTLHKAFGVRPATRAGFAMVPVAAGAVNRAALALGLKGEQRRHIQLCLWRAAGSGGMIGGQVLDLLESAAGQRFPTLEEITDLEARKTGALIAASVEIGATAAGAAEEQLAAYRRYGEDIGLAFQMADDLLDLTATTSELGKTPGKDAKLGKVTFPMVLGLERAQREAEQLAERAVARLAAAGVSSPLLAALARFVVARRS